MTYLTVEQLRILRIIQEGKENILFSTDEWSQPETLRNNVWESHDYDTWHDLVEGGWIEVSNITIDTWPTENYYWLTEKAITALSARADQDESETPDET